MDEAYEAALRFLLRREHSCCELRLKLQKKSHDSDAIDAALSRVIAEGYLCDTRFAEHYARHRLRAGFGPIRISLELEKRGVEQPNIHSALVPLSEEWRSRCQIVREKKFGPLLPAAFIEKAKQSQFLQYRGFSAEHIKQVIKNEEC